MNVKLYFTNAKPTYIALPTNESKFMRVNIEINGTLDNVMPVIELIRTHMKEKEWYEE